MHSKPMHIKQKCGEKKVSDENATFSSYCYNNFYFFYKIRVSNTHITE